MAGGALTISSARSRQAGSVVGHRSSVVLSRRSAAWVSVRIAGANHGCGTRRAVGERGTRPSLATFPPVTEHRAQNAAPRRTDWLRHCWIRMAGRGAVATPIIPVVGTFLRIEARRLTSRGRDAPRGRPHTSDANGQIGAIPHRWLTYDEDVTEGRQGGIPYNPKDYPAHLRATDRERDQIVQVVQSAMTDGRLSTDELDSRLSQVYEAKNHG